MNIFKHPLRDISNELPPFAIFLDIDGVVYKRNEYGDTELINKLKELFPCETEFSRKMAAIARPHLFDKNALKNLDKITREIAKTKSVSFVLISDWRINKTVEDLKNLFEMHNFSKYLVDKTPDSLYSETVKDYCVKDNDGLCRAAEIILNSIRKLSTT